MRDNQDLAQELMNGLSEGLMVALDNTRYDGAYEWDLIPQPGTTLEVERTDAT